VTSQYVLYYDTYYSVSLTCTVHCTYCIYCIYCTLYSLYMFPCFPCVSDVEASSSASVHSCSRFIHIHVCTFTLLKLSSSCTLVGAIISIFGYTECIGRILLSDNIWLPSFLITFGSFYLVTFGYQIERSFLCTRCNRISDNI